MGIATVMQVLGLMDEELMFEWSYQLCRNPHPKAQDPSDLVHEYLAQSFV